MKSKFQPVVFIDPFETVNLRKVAIEENRDGTVKCIEWSVPYLCVRSFVIEQAALGVRYRFIDHEKDPPVSRCAYLKTEALRSGATPEAVRLIGILCPNTKQEEALMADKLSAKGRATADKDALKSAAKATPVGGEKKVPAKKTGNMEALAKANEAATARREALMKDKRKITLTEKGKEKVKKGGEASSVTNLVALRDAKTVGGAITAGLGMADINYAEKTGTITLG